MNKFIWNGFYDNILNSFGWQKINIGVPLFSGIEDDFGTAQFCLEAKSTIPVCSKMPELEFSANYSNYFFKSLPEKTGGMGIYEILQISM